MHFGRLSILGVGLLGGSVGLAVKAISNRCVVTGYGHRRSTLDKALEYGAIDEKYETVAGAVRNADLVILCTPVSIFGDILSYLKGSLKPGAIVTDVGSTKRSIVRQAEALFPTGVRFVGSHPMAGSDKRGVEYARADLFKNATCILTPTPKTDADALKKVELFWQSLGMRTTHLDPAEHDRRLADVSHLPHALAAALVQMQDERSLDLIGNGFLDATRIAGGDGGLWRDIFLDNADNLRGSLVKLQQHLEELTGYLNPDRAEQLKDWLDASAARRGELVKKKVTEMDRE